MNYTFSDEQEELRRTIRRFLEDKSPSSEVRRLMTSAEGYDEAVWKQMAQELGLQGLHIPEEYGGQGFSFVELGIVLEEMGRVLLCAPFYPTVCLAANAILNAGTDEEKRAHLPRIASGEAIATLAFIEPDGTWDASGVATGATQTSGTWTLSGSKDLVVDGTIADLIVVVARQAGSSGSDGIGLFVVNGDADGLNKTSLGAIDETRKLAKLEFSNVRATALGDVSSGGAALSKTLDQAAICLAAEMTGGAQAALDMAVEYAKARVQFGRPIGSFQAIKHKCAEVYLQNEAAKTATYYALWIAADDGDDLPVVASLAKAFCSDAFLKAASENIQVHGGLGFTWEHDAHLYFKRAKSSSLLLGDPTYHREILAQRLGV